MDVGSDGGRVADVVVVISVWVRTVGHYHPPPRATYGSDGPALYGINRGQSDDTE